MLINESRRILLPTSRLVGDWPRHEPIGNEPVKKEDKEILAMVINDGQLYKRRFHVVVEIMFERMSRDVLSYRGFYKFHASMLSFTHLSLFFSLAMDNSFSFVSLADEFDGEKIRSFSRLISLFL